MPIEKVDSLVVDQKKPEISLQPESPVPKTKKSQKRGRKPKQLSPEKKHEIIMTWARFPWLSTTALANKVGVTRQQVLKTLRELGLKNLKPFKAIEHDAQGKKIKRYKVAQTIRENFSPQLRDMVLTKADYFNNLFFGPLLAEFPAPDIVVPLTSPGDMDTSLRNMILKNLRRRLRNEFEHINIAKYGKRTVTAANKKDIDRIVKKARKILKKYGIDARLCPAFTNPTKDDSGVTRMLAEEGELFSPVVLAIPYYNAQPEKRLRIASHLIAKKKTYKLLHPEKPIISADVANKRYGKNHDFIEGVNVTVRTPRNWREWMETMDGGIILSKEAAEKLRYRLVSKPYTILVRDLNDLLLKKDYEFKKGELLVKRSSYKKNYPFAEFLIAPITGKMEIIGKPKKMKRKELGEFYKVKVRFVRERPIQVGDKLVSRTGLKSIVSRIEPREKLGADLIVHPLEIWKEDEIKNGVLKDNRQKRKGGMVLEILNSGGQMFVFPDEGQFIEDNISHKFSLSPTVISGIIARGGTVEDILKYVDKGALRDVFEMLRLKIVKMPDGTYRIAQDMRDPPKGPNTVDFSFDQYGVTYSRLYVAPHVVTLGVNKKGDIYVRALTPENIDSLSPSARMRILNMMRKSGVYVIFNSAMRPVYVFNRKKRAFGAYYTRIVPRNIPVDKIALSEETMRRLGIKPGDKVSIVKEPVTSEWGVNTLTVVRDDTVGLTAGINPLLAAKMNADFDGDQISIFTPPIDKKEFIPTFTDDMKETVEKHKQMLKETKNTEKWLKSLAEKIEFVDDEELAKRTALYNEQIARHESRLIKRRGGPRIDYIAFWPHIQEVTGLDPNTVNLALDIEKAMKKKPYTPEELLQLKQKYGSSILDETIKAQEEAEKADLEREKFVVGLIRQYIRKYVRGNKSLQYFRDIYKENKRALRPSIALMIGKKLEPDKYLSHRIFIEMFGDPIEYNEKTAKYLLLNTERPEVFQVSYAIRRKEKILKKALDSIKVAKRYNNRAMYIEHKERAEKIRQDIVSFLKEAIRMLKNSKDKRAQRELPKLEKKLAQYESMKIG